MTLKSRLQNLEKEATLQIAAAAEAEKSVAARLLETIPRPEDVAVGVWKRALELVADYSPAMLHPWENLEHFAEWCRENPSHGMLNLPIRAMDAVWRAMKEAETGELPPDLPTRNRNDIASLPETPEEQLVAYLRAFDRSRPEYCLPSPYSTYLLKQFPNEGHLISCLYHADSLRRGEITAAEHAAELAKFLPAVTRADQENAVRKLLERPLKDLEAAKRAVQARNGTAANLPDATRPANPS